MLPPNPPELTELVTRRRSDREAEAAAERLRDRPGVRLRTATLLRLIADRLAPELAVPPPWTASSPPH